MGRLCYHPTMRPTAWNQQKPEPCEVITCKCGENEYCPVCGHGRGSYPCTCMRKRLKTGEEQTYGHLHRF
jgi:hypothetical protein